MKILVLGGTGMLGHKLFQTLRLRFPGTMCTTRRPVTHPPYHCMDFLQGPDVITGVDVFDYPRLESVLFDLKPDYVINCVGVIKQRDAAALPIPSLTINSLLPHKLATTTSRWGGRLIHFSTDCVFSGRRGAYVETDLSDAEDLYGKSKYLGEVAADNALTLRTSIIGRELTEHHSLLDWFLSQTGGQVRGFRRVMYSGVTTNEMANVISLILTQYPGLAGLYQVVSSPISKHDLLCLIRDAFRLTTHIEPDDTIVSDRSMRGDKFQQATGYVAPSWSQLVDSLAYDNTPYEEWVKLA